MTALIDLYRRLDRLQQGRRFRLVASLLVVVLCGAVFGSLLVTSYNLDAQRRALVPALTDQSLRERDEHAVSLFNRGEVYLNGRTYGGEFFLRYREALFDQQGNLNRPEALAERLLADQRPGWAPSWMLEQPGTTWMLALISTAWFLLVIWLGLSLSCLITAAATLIPVSACLGLDRALDPPLGGGGLEKTALALGGIGLLTFTFVLLSRVALAVFNRPWQIFAIAHTVVKEASRTNLSLSFIILLLVALPLVPLWMDHDAPLRFQVQTFISRSMGITFLVAACLTLMLSCATVAFEIRDRQIWQTMTKPVGRLNYLVGKWLGVISVNLVILLVSGVSIFTFVQYLRRQPVEPGLAGQLDAEAVRNEVLTARVSRSPDYHELTDEQKLARLNQEIERTPELARLDGPVPVAVRRKKVQEIVDGYELAQRTIPPLSWRHYTFSGLQPAKRAGEALTLRYRFHILRSDEHETYRAVFRFNENERLDLLRLYVPTVSHVLSVPAEWVRDDGTLTVSIYNLYEAPPAMRGFGALNFEHDDFELMHKVGNFEGNFLRAVLLNWVKLSFLAMLGICCATMFSFSVSCLASFTVFIGGAMGPYLAEALSEYYPPPTSHMDWGDVALVIQWAFQWSIKGVAEVVVFALQGFGRTSASQMLVEGRYIYWGDVLVHGVAKLGLLWSGVVLLGGFITLRSRQLAIYSGHG